MQANEQYTRLPADDQKAMRFVWLTARNDTIKKTNEEGMGKTSRAELLQYVNPNVSVPQSESDNFTFDKEFFFLYNKEVDPKLVSCIDNALKEVYAEGEIQKELKKSFFIPNFKPSSEAQAYLKDKRDQYAEIIENIK